MLALMAMTLAIAGIAPQQDIVPCVAGASATYQGTIRFTKANSSEVMAQSMAWTTRFIDCFRGPDITVALVEGLPLDLDWYEPGPKAGRYAFIQTKVGLFLTTIRDPSLDARTLASQDIDRDDLVFRVGQKVGECAATDSDETENNGMYCWLLENIRSGPFGPARHLSYRTNPDDSQMEFVPGTGLTHYEYHHHGTVAEVDMTLRRPGNAHGSRALRRDKSGDSSDPKKSHAPTPPITQASAIGDGG